MTQWTIRLSLACLVLAGLVGWRIVSVRQSLAHLQRAHQHQRTALTHLHTELQRLAAIPPGAPVDSLEHAMHRVRAVIAGFHEAGLSANLSTAPPITVTLDTVSLPAIPCRLLLQADSLPQLITAVQLLERTQVRLTSWQLTAQTATVAFQVIGGETQSAPTVVAAQEGS